MKKSIVSRGLQSNQYGMEAGPSPGCPTRGWPKNYKGVTFFKCNIGCMQKQEGQTWNGGRVPLPSPPATTLFGRKI